MDNELHSGIYLPTKYGEWMFLRPITPADRPFIERTLSYVSAETLKRRFATTVTNFSESYWDKLLNVDQENHVAWGILPLDDPDFATAGVGRFVRLAQEPDVAEFALTITDASQGRGLGTVLFALIIWLARHKQVRELQGLVEADNERMLAWMRQVGAHIEPAESGQSMVTLHLENLAFPAGSHLATLLERLEQLNVGPPEERVLDHPHQTILRPVSSSDG